MFEAKCYDMHGNSVNEFMQWDIDQEIVIQIEPCGEDHIEQGYMKIDPEVHFANVKREKALVVRASLVDDRDDVIKVKVPNILLTEPYPLLIYVYYTSSKNSAAQSTIVYTELPVKKRNEPHDYYYVENIERITAEMIKEEISGVLNEKIDNEFEDIKENLAAETQAMRDDIDEFEKGVRGALDTVSKQLVATNARMDEIEDLFEDTTDDVNKALKDISDIAGSVSDLREFAQKVEADSNICYVEDQTLYAKNVNVAQNLTVGNFIWVNGASGNMSLKWIGRSGGDA